MSADDNDKRAPAAASPSTLPGVLHVVATPIGNLGDITRRACELLCSVETVLCEDTRSSQKLLRHIGSARPLQALHEHNERSLLPRLIERLRNGAQLALISDAGTPLISDPGFRLVAAAHAAQLRVSPVPGPCAALAALSAAGLATDRFCFEGFLPAKGAARRAKLAELAAEPRTMVFYEAPHRLQECVQDMIDCFGPARPATLARELTKTFETVKTGDLAGLRALIDSDPNQCRGEIVLVLAGAPAADADAALGAARKLYAELCSELAPSRAAKLAARIHGVSRRDLYEPGADNQS